MLAGCSSGSEPAEQATEGLGSDSQNAVYAMGLNMAAQLQKQDYTAEKIKDVRAAILDAADAAAAGNDVEELKAPADVDADAYQRGIDLFLSVKPMRLTQEEFELLTTAISDADAGTPKIDLETYRPLIAKLARERANAEANAEKERSEKFLEEAAAKPGVEVTVSGLIFKDITEGTGRKPNTQSQVKVNYRGTLVDGTEFDSSYGKQPYQAYIASLIPCWTEGIRKMKAGGKAELICPADLAYGEAGSPPKIPPNAALIFEIELLDVK